MPLMMSYQKVHNKNCNVLPVQEVSGGREPHPSYDLKCEETPSFLPQKLILVQRGKEMTLRKWLHCMRSSETDYKRGWSHLLGRLS